MNVQKAKYLSGDRDLIQVTFTDGSEIITWKGIQEFTDENSGESTISTELEFPQFVVDYCSSGGSIEEPYTRHLPWATERALLKFLLQSIGDDEFELLAFYSQLKSILDSGKFDDMKTSHINNLSNFIERARIDDVVKAFFQSCLEEFQSQYRFFDHVED